MTSQTFQALPARRLGRGMEQGMGVRVPQLR